MELRQLEHFVAVAEERHFTRAAERLMISQSALSASVRALERELAVRLFARNTRSVELTAPGRVLLTEARRALGSVRAAKEAVEAVQGLLRGTLSVGTEQCVAGVDVPALLARFRSAHPGVEIRLRQADSATLIGEVAACRLDLAFVALPDEAPADLRMLPLTREPMVLLCHPDHRLAEAREVRWAELGGEHFIDFHPGWGARGLTDRAFAAAGAARQVSLEVNDVHTLIDLVGHGLGVAVVPEPIARKPQAAALAVVRLTGASPEPFWRLSVAAPPPDTTAPAALKLIDYLPGAS
ncbi:LysR family transcriptional regulator [Microbispora sp. NPDC046933]|uniref:LysR family transcriptional regulator n=1 Tax=Microbispora sp. NPDC046933 TaxID=3155618 RepID=UPI00340C398C